MTLNRKCQIIKRKWFKRWIFLSAEVCCKVTVTLLMLELTVHSVRCFPFCTVVSTPPSIKLNLSFCQYRCGLWPATRRFTSSFHLVFFLQREAEERTTLQKQRRWGQIRWAVVAEGKDGLFFLQAWVCEVLSLWKKLEISDFSELSILVPRGSGFLISFFQDRFNKKSCSISCVSLPPVFNVWQSN